MSEFAIITEAHAANEDIQALLDSFPELPSIPEVLVRIWKLLDDPNSSASDLEEVVALEPSLAAKVLRLCNSPYYGGNGKVNNVRMAITALGFDTLRNLAICLSVADKLAVRAHGNTLLQRKELWRHCVATAVLARSISKELKLDGCEELFTAGLLHDIGKFVISLGMPDAYDEIVRRMQCRNITLLAAEEEVLGFDHCSLGTGFAQRWNFPLSLQDLIANHHGMAEGEQAKQKKVLSLANRLSYRLEEYDVLPGIEPLQIESGELSCLGIDEQWLEDREQKFRESIEGAQEFMNLI